MRIALDSSPLIVKAAFASFSLGGILIHSTMTITTTTFGARPV